MRQHDSNCALTTETQRRCQLTVFGTTHGRRQRLYVLSIRVNFTSEHVACILCILAPVHRTRQEVGSMWI